MLQDAPPEGQNWIHEIKFDGYRLQAHVDDVSVKLLTRKVLDWTARFPSIVRALQPLRVAPQCSTGCSFSKMKKAFPISAACNLI